MTNKRRAIYVGSAVLILAVIALVWGRSGYDGGHRAEIEKVTLGVPSIDSSLLAYVAQNKQFFTERGLEVSIKDFETGVLATDALIAGEVDVAIATEFVLVQKGFEKGDLRTFGTIGSTNATEMVVRKGRGIVRPSDLKGKRIGVVKGAAQEFFLDTFLMQNNVDRSTVQLVYLSPSGITSALEEGSVDAGCLFNPHLYNAKKRFGNEAISWPIQHHQDYYFVLVSKDGFIEKRPIVVERLLSAFIDAQGFVEHDSGEAMVVLQKMLKLDEQYVKEIWPKSTFRVTLPQDLIVLMNHEAKWLLKQDPSNKVYAYNAFRLVYLEGLKKIRPQAVGIIH
jgi:NitT/TauT family transport system substrate-binding protein